MILNRDSLLRLSDLKPRQDAVVVGLKDELPRELSLRLRELGLIEGAKVELIRKAPWFGNPLSIRVLDGEYALRREHAELIEVALR